MSPLRRFLKEREQAGGFVPPSDAVVAYAEIVFITVAAVVVLAIGLAWVWTQLRSADGLSGAEIGSLISIAISGLTQLTVWRLGFQNKVIDEKADEVKHQTNGKLVALERQIANKEERSG